jgi:hypothetical protein
MADLVIHARLSLPEEELRVEYARSGGPGGQNVNKVETKVQVRWNPAESEAISEADRAWLLTRLASRLTTDGDLLVSLDADALPRAEPRGRAPEARGGRAGGAPASQAPPEVAPDARVDRAAPGDEAPPVPHEEGPP